MKKYSIEQLLMAAAPPCPAKGEFTNTVMAKIARQSRLQHNALLKEKRRGPLFTRLRHLPKFALVIMAVVVIAVASTTAYAVVTTVKQLFGATVSSVVVNDTGRRQVSATLQDCGRDKDKTVTFELKKGSTLKDEEVEKVIQARCELLRVADWQDEYNSQQIPRGMPQGGATVYPSGLFASSSHQAYSVENIANNTMTFSVDGDMVSPKIIDENTKFYENDREIAKSAIATGDTVGYVSTTVPAAPNTEGLVYQMKLVAVFKFTHEPHFYGNVQEQLTVREECLGNPSLTCVKTRYMVQIAYGGALPSLGDTRELRQVQGKLLSSTASELIIEADMGQRYTIETKANVIELFNRQLLPDIATGDFLDISYTEPKGVYKTHIPYDGLTSIFLMTESNSGYPQDTKKY